MLELNQTIQDTIILFDYFQYGRNCFGNPASQQHARFSQLICLGLCTLPLSILLFIQMFPVLCNGSSPVMPDPNLLSNYRSIDQFHADAQLSAHILSVVNKIGKYSSVSTKAPLNRLWCQRLYEISILWRGFHSKRDKTPQQMSRDSSQESFE
jgi:hypothetical protein